MKLLLSLLPLLLFSNVTVDQRAPSGVNVFVDGYLLYWTARQDGIAFARQGVTDLDHIVTSKQDTLFPGNDWDVGFRVGIGVHLDHDNWNTGFTYTRFTSDDSNNKEGSFATTWDVGGIQGVTSQGFTVPILARYGEADWSLIYNNFVLALSKDFSASPFVVFRPCIGLAATWHKQTYDVLYLQLSQSTSYRMNLKQNNWGIGLLGGLESDWFISKWWGFYGKIALASLWSRFHITREDEVSGDRLVYNTTNFHTVKAMLDLGLGLRFDYSPESGKVHLSGSVGWEEQVWFNENQFQRISYSSGLQGDLILQGLSVKLRLDY